jgi:amino acid transporter, AAT family
MVVMFFTWLFLSRRESEQSAGSMSEESEPLLSNPGMDDGSPSHLIRDKTLKYHDLVDTDTVDLIRDEYDEEDDMDGEDQVTSRLSGKMKLLWTFYYWLV